MKKRLFLGLILFVLGLLGVFSLLWMEIPIKSIPPEILNKISASMLKWLILINPTIMLLGAVLMGIFTFNKVGLKVPIISYLIGYEDLKPNWKEILIYGAALGTLSGILIIIVSHLFKSYAPVEFAAINQELELSPFTRFLYGGITEEILTRFGLMSLIVYILSFALKQSLSLKYWLGIIFTAVIFGLGHLPIVFQTVVQPTIILIVFIILGNFLAGLIFGWLYWKKGLESAMIAHIFAHITMLSIESLV